MVYNPSTMGGERYEKKGQNDVLLENIPEIAKDLSNLWDCFANTTIGFAGGGHFGNGPQPPEMGLTWSRNVQDLIEDCTIPVTKEKNWGKMLTALNDLSEDLFLEFGPMRKQLSRLDRSMLKIRINNNATYLLEEFTERGYLQKENKPFQTS